MSFCLAVIRGCYSSLSGARDCPGQMRNASSIPCSPYARRILYPDRRQNGRRLRYAAGENPCRSKRQRGGCPASGRSPSDPGWGILLHHSCVPEYRRMPYWVMGWCPHLSGPYHQKTGPQHLELYSCHSRDHRHRSCSGEIPRHKGCIQLYFVIYYYHFLQNYNGDFFQGCLFQSQWKFHDTLFLLMYIRYLFRHQQCVAKRFLPLYSNIRCGRRLS